MIKYIVEIEIISVFFSVCQGVKMHMDVIYLFHGLNERVFIHPRQYFKRVCVSLYVLYLFHCLNKRARICSSQYIKCVCASLDRVQSRGD